MNDDLFVSSAQMAEAVNYNEWVFSLFQDYIDGSVLEVGCGVGNFTQKILDSGRAEKVLSIDISKDAIKFCENKFKDQKNT